MVSASELLLSAGTDWRLRPGPENGTYCRRDSDWGFNWDRSETVSRLKVCEHGFIIQSEVLRDCSVMVYINKQNNVASRTTFTNRGTWIFLKVLRFKKNKERRILGYQQQFTDRGNNIDSYLPDLGAFSSSHNLPLFPAWPWKLGGVCNVLTTCYIICRYFRLVAATQPSDKHPS